MSDLFVQETHINASEDYIYDETPIYLAFTEKTGDLFRYCQQELGRCISSVYVDSPTGTKKVGWVFQKNEEYSDTREKYTKEVWITIFTKDANGKFIHLNMSRGK